MEHISELTLRTEEEVNEKNYAKGAKSNVVVEQKI